APAAPPAETTAPRPASAPARPAPFRVARAGESHGVVRHRFDSGPVLLHERRSELPLVTLCVAFRGGRSGEGRESPGITRRMQSTMIKGSAARDARQVALQIEGLGSSIERLIDEDYFGFALSILSKHVRRGYDILMDIVRRPAFRHEEL